MIRMEDNGDCKLVGTKFQVAQQFIGICRSMLKYFDQEYLVECVKCASNLDSDTEIKESKFKVGDKVRLKEGLVVGEVYDGVRFLREMQKAEIMTIRMEIDRTHYFTDFMAGNNFLDDLGMIMSEEMLEKVEETHIPEL